MSFLKDAGHALVQGPMTYSISKPLQMMKKIDAEDMRDISKISALIGAAALGGVAMGSGAGAAGGNVGGTGGPAAGAAPQIGAYPGITPGVATGPSNLAMALKIGGFLGNQQAPPAPTFGGLSGGQIQSSKQNNMPVRRRYR
jgi:hypothetical protein